MLFSTNEIMYREEAGENFMKRLNHASRKDLKRQMAVREKYLKKIAEKQK